jgi:glycopeptide antibiotics resistance protein
VITDFLLEHSALVPVALLLIPIVALTLVPGSTDVSGVACSFQFVMPRPGSVELLANVALLFPAVYFAALATKRPVATFTVAVVLSAVIEAIQALIPALARSCDTGDWAMNCLGALIAAILAAITLSLANRIG